MCAKMVQQQDAGDVRRVVDRTRTRVTGTDAVLLLLLLLLLAAVELFSLILFVARGDVVTTIVHTSSYSCAWTWT
jgi:hypothetical protein